MRYNAKRKEIPTKVVQNDKKSIFGHVLTFEIFWKFVGMFILSLSFRNHKENWGSMFWFSRYNVKRKELLKKMARKWPKVEFGHVPTIEISEILQGCLFDHYPSETIKKMEALCANFWDIMPNARKYRRKWCKMTKNRFLGMFAPLNFLKICRDVYLIIIFQKPSRKLRIHVLFIEK